MIETLSQAMGLAINDPVFWVPLALMGVLVLLILGLMLIDGIALGVGLVLPWVLASERLDMLKMICPWQRANERWLPLLFGVSIAAFPLAWSQMIEGLYAPILMVTAGALLRSLAIRRGERWVWLYVLASLLGAVGFGLLLAGYATGQRFHWAFTAFDVLMSLSMLAVFGLLGTSWLLIKWQTGPVVNRIAKLGAAWARWSAAGMVALSFVLALANPAIFYKWTNGHHLQVAALWWTVMLVAFVWLDHLLRTWCCSLTPIVRRVRMPLLLSWLLLGLMFVGLIYSVFPFLVLDELTLWDAAASAESLSLVVVVAAVAGLSLLAVQIWDYRKLLACDVSARQ